MTVRSTSESMLVVLVTWPNPCTTRRQAGVARRAKVEDVKVIKRIEAEQWQTLNMFLALEYIWNIYIYCLYVKKAQVTLQTHGTWFILVLFWFAFFQDALE